MRKIVLFSISILFIAKCLGQDSKFNFGLELGPTIESIRSNNLTYKSKLNFVAGLNTIYMLNSNLYIKSGLFYEEKGGKQYIGAGLIGARDVFYNLDYLIVPVSIMLITKGKIRYYTILGSYVGFLLKNVIDQNLSPNIISNYIDQSNKFDFGLSFGLGILIPLNDNFDIDCQIRDDLGLTNILKISGANNYKTNSLMFSFGLNYKF